MGLHTIHSATGVEKGSVAHRRGCEDLDGQVRDPVTQRIMPSFDEAAIFAIKCVRD